MIIRRDFCIVAGLVALLGLTPGVRAQATASPALAEAISARVKQEMESKKIVGLAVSLASGESIIFTGAYGFADRESKIPATDQTMFRWASVSKPMTAVAAMQLVADGKLDLGADVRTLVPEFPAKAFPITSRQLLCHQGGIVHYSNGPVIKTERTYTEPHPFKDVVLALDTFKESPLVNEPGAKYNYTTHGYILLSAVVQRAAKQDFADVVHSRIAGPLGMTTLRPDYQWEDIPSRTKGYRREKSGEVVPSTDTDVSWKLGGGGWISTAGDMARFGAGMLGDKLVHADTRMQMWTDQATSDGKETGYGLGFSVKDRDGQLIISHSGAQEKTATFLLIVPGSAEKPADGGVVAAVMCNTEDTSLGQLAGDLASLVRKQVKQTDAKE